MKNYGARPEVEVCDIRYRCGHVVRGVDPKKRRWEPWPTGESAYDITDWQIPAGGKAA